MRDSRRIVDEGEGKVTSFVGKVAKVKEPEGRRGDGRNEQTDDLGKKMEHGAKPADLTRVESMEWLDDMHGFHR